MNNDIFVTKSTLPPFEEYVKEIESIWNTHWLTNMGEKHNRLEKELCAKLGVNSISLFCNGHMALELVIQALGLSGEVITTPFTFASTTHAIVRNGLTPVFCDINPQNYTIDVNKIEELINEKTSAIIPVHVYGNVCDVIEIDKIAKKYNLKVVYDAAHAFGVKYKGLGIGCYGDASMFSFHATKVFNTIEGGAIAYKDERIGRRLYELKNFGIKNEEEVVAVGANAKMNEFAAAMGLCNLRHFDESIENRKRVFNIYNDNLAGVDGIIIPRLQDDVERNYSYYPIIVEEEIHGVNRDVIYCNLLKQGIHARKYFYPITTDFNCYKELYTTSRVEVAKRISSRVLTLPMYESLDEKTILKICDVIRDSIVLKH